MTKGLFTNSEEIRFYDVYVKGNIPKTKGQSMDVRQVKHDAQSVSQNVKRLNQKAIQARMRIRSR